ncbi:Sigma-70 family RNA polymerase sigma factor [Sulfidibacter corallicola]|uniref:Sigma-70 family RNA polymerase sigma factor n=1 Tax=Sulfidibacter corallicola TaxID=2818388 RepID=A0A8A4TS16_SULCO|nr:sigma-70 family RNA polymerase sigma factor [Sulfidibacter corallicola]QTD51862.1 sigma-70 family RNA polymerase sigma factor [Sulfidibacter corallicola]
MNDQDNEALTRMLNDWGDGDTRYVDELWPQLAESLQNISRKVLREFVFAQGRGASLTSLDLLHEAYPKLVRHGANPSREWQNRKEFFALAKKIMLCALLDYNRRMQRREGKDDPDYPLEDLPYDAKAVTAEHVMSLEKSLEMLAEISPRQTQIIKLRFFEDYTIDSIMEELDMSKYKVQVELKVGLGFLRRKMALPGKPA